MKVIDPVFKISQELFCDAIQNKFMDEMIDSTQQVTQRIVECFSRLPPQETTRSFSGKLSSFYKGLFYPAVHQEVGEERLFSDLYKNLTKCEIS